MAAGEAEDGAELIAGGAVVELGGDLFEIGDVIFGRHGDATFPERGEVRFLGEDAAVFRVGVEDVDGLRGSCVGGGLLEEAAEQAADGGRLERVEEEEKEGAGGKRGGEGVALDEAERGEELVGARLGGGKVDACDGGHGGGELDADDLAEGGFGGDEHGTALAGADVDKGVVVEGEGWVAEVLPEVEEGAEDGGRDAVVGGDEAIGGGARAELVGGDEAAGVDAMGGVEGVDGCGRRLDGWRGAAGVGWRHGQRICHQVAVAIETEGAAAGGGDAKGGPGRGVLEGDGGGAESWEAGEAVEDLGAKLGFGGVVGLGGGVRVRASRKRGGTPGMLAPGASGSGVRWRAVR